MPDFAQILYQVELLTSNCQPPKAATLGDRNELDIPVTQIHARFTVELASRKLELLADQIRHGQVETMLILYDRYGNVTNSLVKTFDLTLTPDQYVASLQNGIPLGLDIERPNGSEVSHVRALWGALGIGYHSRR